MQEIKSSTWKAYFLHKTKIKIQSLQSIQIPNSTAIHSTTEKPKRNFKTTNWFSWRERGRKRERHIEREERSTSLSVYYIWTKEVEKERASIWDWGRWSRTRGGWASGQYEGPLILPPICFCLGFQKRSINLTLTFPHSLPLFPLLLIYFFYFWSKFFLIYFILIYFPNLAAARVVRASPAVAVTTEMWVPPFCKRY